MMAPYGFPPPVAFPPQAPVDRDIPPPPSSAAPAAADDEKKDEDEGEYADVSFSDIFKQFILLGWTAFGGPAAHIALFQKVGNLQRIPGTRPAGKRPGTWILPIHGQFSHPQPCSPGSSLSLPNPKCQESQIPGALGTRA